jgi:DNA repair exonuclease SbcCD ATPase subunit
MKKELEQLCQPLNVDKTDAEIIEEYGELTLELEESKEAIEEHMNDLVNYKNELEEIEENIEAFSEWLKTNIESHFKTERDNTFDEILTEFNKLFRPFN